MIINLNSDLKELALLNLKKNMKIDYCGIYGTFWHSAILNLKYKAKQLISMTFFLTLTLKNGKKIIIDQLNINLDTFVLI